MNWYRTIRAMPLAPVINEYPERWNESLKDMKLNLSQETIDKKMPGERAYLGHGYWGVAYDVPSGAVEKISRSDDDWKNAQEIMKRQEEEGKPLSFCVQVYDAEIIQENPIFYRFIIEKADRMDPATAEKFDSYLLHMKARYGRNIENSRMLSLEDMRFIQNEYNIPDEDLPLMEQIRQFLLAIKSHNVSPWDVTSSNVGFRGNDIVILDIGSFDFR